MNKHSISVRRSIYDQLKAYAREHNVTMASIVELAVAKDLASPEEKVFGPSHDDADPHLVK